MARGLDHWGIEGGEIMERVAELSQAVRGCERLRRFEYLPQGMERVRLMMFWAKLTTSCLNACDWERKLKFLPELKTSAQLCLS